MVQPHKVMSMKLWQTLFWSVLLWCGQISYAQSLTQTSWGFKIPDMQKIAHAYVQMNSSLQEVRAVTRADRPNTPLKMVVAPLVTFLESAQIVLVELIEVSELIGDIVVTFEETSDCLCALLLSRGVRKTNMQLAALFKSLRCKLQQECPLAAFFVSPLKSLFASNYLTFFFESLIDDITAIIALLEADYRLEGDLAFEEPLKEQPV